MTTKAKAQQEYIDFTSKLLDQMEALEKQVAGYKADAIRYRALVAINGYSEEYMNSVIDEFLENNNQVD